MTDFEPSHAAALVAARIAAGNHFGADADLSTPHGLDWMREYADSWRNGVQTVRMGLARIMEEPNAWQHRDMVFAMFLDEATPADVVITALRALPCTEREVR